jgi:thiazole synthase/sulfur carrier protein
MIRVNGKEREIVKGCKLLTLLQELGVEPGKGVAVERNREIVPRERYKDVVLEDGDVLEIVTLVGGG